jgi:hypothetical protein
MVTDCQTLDGLFRAARQRAAIGSAPYIDAQTHWHWDVETFWGWLQQHHDDSDLSKPECCP